MIEKVILVLRASGKESRFRSSWEASWPRRRRWLDGWMTNRLIGQTHSGDKVEIDCRLNRSCLSLSLNYLAACLHIQDDHFWVIWSTTTWSNPCRNTMHYLLILPYRIVSLSYTRTKKLDWVNELRLCLWGIRYASSRLKRRRSIISGQQCSVISSHLAPSPYWVI